MTFRPKSKLRRQFETELIPSGSSQPLPTRTRLTSQWSVGEDGKLVCQWTAL